MYGVSELRVGKPAVGIGGQTLGSRILGFWGHGLRSKNEDLIHDSV